MTSRQIIIVIFLAIFISFLVTNNVMKPRIMILQSYSPDFAWSKDIDVGIDRILKGKPVLIRRYYLDTKRNPERDYMVRAGAAAIFNIRKWKPDVLIAVDDDAQEYVAKYFINEPNMSIVFNGVNGTAEQYGYDKAENVTGVLERVPFQAVQEVFEDINPKGHFIHICDNSDTSRYIQEELETFNWSPLNLIATKRCPTFADWQKVVIKANQEADFLLITHYHTIKDAMGNTMKPKDVIDWTRAHTTIPLIGCWDFFVADGGALSISVSPYEQGELSAKMAIDIIEHHRRAKDIPITRNTLFTVSLRGSELKKNNIRIPTIFESFARGLDHYYE